MMQSRSWLLTVKAVATGQYLSMDLLAAMVAWFVVSASAIWIMITFHDYSIASFFAVAMFLLTFIVLFLIANANEEAQFSQLSKNAMVLVQLLSIIFVVCILPYYYIAILSTIWCAQLPYYYRMGYCFLLSFLASASFYVIFQFYWQDENVLLTALLFWSFNLFALAAMNTTRKESIERAKSDALNRELLATQALLREATRQSERIRIARDIHDLLGHHLTALTINLQVAYRTSEGSAQAQIKQCHDLAKLLLSDVREAVSEIREKSEVDIYDAISLIVKDVPRLTISLNVDKNIKLTDVKIAEVIIRSVQECITNTLKHSRSDQMWIKISRFDGCLTIDVSDNAKRNSDQAIKHGNGLTGMRERVHELNGHAEFSLTKNGFKTVLHIPEQL